MNNDVIRRRRFLEQACAGVAGTTILPLAVAKSAAGTGNSIRFGLIADIHKDVMHDADHRLQVFIDRVKKERVDFILQMGDFCIPIPENREFLGIWDSFAGPRHHVLGNHDMDGDGRNRPDKAYAFTREETVQYWGMKSRYYSFDVDGVHCVILDGNEKAPKQGDGYRRYVAKGQSKWLVKDLAATELPTAVFIHQSLERENGGIENQQEIRAIMENAKRRDGSLKVIACFSGHHHRDYVRRVNGILYPQINSASYHWLGGQYLRVRYGQEIDKKYPYIKYTVPYKDPLYALVTIDTDRGFLKIEGTQTEFVGPPPWEIGKSRREWDANTLAPTISDWKIPV